MPNAIQTAALEYLEPQLRASKSLSPGGGSTWKRRGLNRPALAPGGANATVGPSRPVGRTIPNRHADQLRGTAIPTAPTTTRLNPRSTRGGPSGVNDGEGGAEGDGDGVGDARSAPSPDEHAASSRAAAVAPTNAPTLTT